MTISVITVTFYSGKTVRDTIESVLQQSWHEVDYIIVDGASTDDTLSIAKEYVPKSDGRMRIVSEPDKGIYDAMNKGLQMASGDVVGFLNSDDYFTSDDVLERVAETFQDENVDAVYGDVHYVSPNDTTKRMRYYSSRFFSRPLMRFGFMPAHPSFYCKRSIYAEYGGFDISYRIAADFENLLRLIYVNRIRTCYINKDFVTMRAGGISNANFANRWQIMRDHVRALRENGVYSNYLFLGLRYFYKLYELIRR